jgi:adenylate cyclase class 2
MKLEWAKRMQYEVEQKYAVSDRVILELQLDKFGIVWGETVQQRDAYYNHPARDFSQTDEAIRIRTSAGKDCITYKGPRIDQTTKTRQEIEIPLGAHTTSEAAEQLLVALGFMYVAVVEKTRRTGTLTWQDHPLTIAIDEVVGLGTYIEIELMASEESLSAAQVIVQQAADKLQLQGSIRVGYLDLLLSDSHPQ